MNKTSLAVAAVTACCLTVAPAAAPAQAAPHAGPTPTAGATATSHSAARTGSAQRDRAARVLLAQTRSSGLHKALERVRQASQESDPARCDTTELKPWMDQQGRRMNGVDDVLAGEFLTLAVVDAALHPEDQSYGADGVDTAVLQATLPQLKSFWDADTSKVRMVPMHSESLANRQRMTSAIAALGVSPQWARVIGAGTAAYFGSARFDHGHNPLLSFNSVAIPDGALTLQGKPLPATVVMGDGLSRAFRDLGYGAVAPQSVLAHEFGHQVQFADQVPTTGQGARASERMELMADAFSGYFLTHSRGQAMGEAQVRQLSRVFFDIGDCQVDAAGHHGTPAQRRGSLLWARSASRADAASISPSKVFVDRFDEALPAILTTPATTVRLLYPQHPHTA